MSVFPDERTMTQPLYLLKGRHYIDLDIPLIQNTKCLLLGAGTLGCNVARALLSWGFRHFTFVDQGTVGATNPLKQTLYRAEDIGTTKAITAATRIKEINPYATTDGYLLEIPMPGHSIFDSEIQVTISAIHMLDTLIQTHDVVWLLTDTRESRWLPTVLASHHQKPIMSVGLGLDQYMAMYTQPCVSSCYCCNDATPPGNSFRHRTVEERCSIVRSGLSWIASGIAVELFVSHLQSNTSLQTEWYTIRGSCIDYSILKAERHSPNENCSSCSHMIQTIMETQGIGFVFAVCNDESLLPSLCQPESISLVDVIEE